MSDRFTICLPITLAYEGGYVDNPKDPGGATNLGVTLKTFSGWLGRPATKAEVKALKRADVEPIYRKNYWDAAGCGGYLPGADLVVFDGGVMSGVSRSVGWAKQVKANADAKAFVGQFCDLRLGFLKRLTTFKTFGSGWSKRVAFVRAKATTMALEWMGVTGAAAKQQLEVEAARAEGQAKSDTTKATSAAAPAAASPVVAPAAGVESTSGWVLLGLVAVLVLGAAAFLFIRARNRRDEAVAFRAEAAAV